MADFFFKYKALPNNKLKSNIQLPQKLDFW